MFINVITRNLFDLDEPPIETQINYASHNARIWLAKHCGWAITPAYGSPSIAVGP